MGLMSRASLVMKAKLSKAIDKAEDPGETLDYSYERQLELLRNVKQGIADVVTAKKRLQLQTSQLEQSIPTLEEQARQALAQGREDLARAALERKSAAQAQLQALDAQVTQLEGQLEKLITSEKQLSLRSAPDKLCRAASATPTCSSSSWRSKYATRAPVDDRRGILGERRGKLNSEAAVLGGGAG